MSRSGATPEELGGYLAKVRRIARMPDEDALAETDELLFVYRMASGLVPSAPAGHSGTAQSELSSAREEIAEIEETLVSAMDGDPNLDSDDIEVLEESLAEIGEDWSDGIADALAEELNHLRASAVPQLQAIWQRWAGENAQQCRAEIVAWKKSLAAGESHYWLMDHARSRAEEFGEDWPDQALQGAAKVVLDELRRDALAVAVSADIAAGRSKITEARNEVLSSVRTVGKVLRELSEAEELLRRHDHLTVELRHELRAARERCAWFRAAKKRTDAALAVRLGEPKKAKKLAVLAQLLLEQDWPTVFGDENVPIVEIES